MWITLLSGLLLIASAVVNATEDKVAMETETEAQVPGFEGKLPTAQELLEMLDSMAGISDEEKESLKEELMKNIESGGFPTQAMAGNDLGMQTVILFSLLGLVALIFVFFVYKLFKCLTQREMKREEKKKMKQLKKKK